MVAHGAKSDRVRISSALDWAVVVLGWACFFGGFLLPQQYLLAKGTLLAVARVLP
jgi:hypothetical protein